MKKVCIILINWNSLSDTKECIDSILNSSYKDFDILVIDNNSEIKPKNFVNNNVKVILLNENLGFAGANNIGIKYAIKYGYEYVWILNNDTIVLNNTLQELIKAVNTTKYQIIASLILYWTHRELIWFAGGYFSKLLGKGVHIGKNKRLDKKYLLQKEIEFVTGCSIFIKTALFEKIGLFDEDLFAYSEDLEISLRIKKYGFKILYFPSSILYHKVGKSFQINNNSKKGKSSPLQVYLFNRNRIIVAKRYLSGFYYILFIIRFLFLNILKIIILLIIFRKEKAKKLLMALLDGIKYKNE